MCANKSYSPLFQSAWAAHLQSTEHKSKTAVAQGDGVFLVNQCFNKRITTYRIMAEDSGISIVDFLAYAKAKVLQILQLKIAEFSSLKFYSVLFGQFVKITTGEEATKSFNIKTQSLSSLEGQYDELWETLTERIIARYQDFQEKDSGMTAHVSNFIISIIKKNKKKKN